MLAETTIELEARNPDLNRMRRWKVELGQDLLGMWVVDVAFGRIGSRGRTIRHVFASQRAAHTYVGTRLRRRRTALARIGVAYRCVSASIEAAKMLADMGFEASQKHG
jgi:predicted DNA-binding WGR domain protein